MKFFCWVANGSVVDAGSLEVQVGWGFEEGVPAHGRVVGTR